MFFETDRPDLLDPALLRSGRIDRHVRVSMPDQKERELILKVHVKGKPLYPDIDLAALAEISEGLSGADIENWVNESAITAARRNKKAIGMDDFREVIRDGAIVRVSNP